MLLVAHRTPPSRGQCERLAAAGAQIFEVDVQLGDDDQIVVSHYFPLTRFPLVQRDNWRFRWHTRAVRDVTLEAAAAVVPDDCLVLLDLKERSPERRARLLAAIVAAPVARERLRACGPYRADLEELRAAGLRTWRTAGTRAELDAVRAEGQLSDDVVTIRHSLLTAPLLRGLHDQVSAVVAWTVNDSATATRLRDLGVDGITTDRAAVLSALSAAG